MEHSFKLGDLLADSDPPDLAQNPDTVNEQTDENRFEDQSASEFFEKLFAVAMSATRSEASDTMGQIISTEFVGGSNRDVEGLAGLAQAHETIVAKQKFYRPPSFAEQFGVGTHPQQILSRNSTKTLKCPKCNWHYKYQETLEIHMKEKHFDGEIHCTYCTLNQVHPKLARGESYSCGYKPYRCELCKYSTTTKGNLSIHMQSDKHLNAVNEMPSSFGQSSIFQTMNEFVVESPAMSTVSTLAMTSSTPTARPTTITSIEENKLDSNLSPSPKFPTSPNSSVQIPLCRPDERMLSYPLLYFFQCLICSAFNSSDLEDMIEHLETDRSHTFPGDIQVGQGAFQCNLCPYATNLKANFQLHIRTDKHIQRIQLVNHVREGHQSGIQNASTALCRLAAMKSVVQVRCNLCQELFSCSQTLREHCASSAHEARRATFARALLLKAAQHRKNTETLLIPSSNNFSISDYCAKIDNNTGPAIRPFDLSSIFKDSSFIGSSSMIPINDEPADLSLTSNQYHAFIDTTKEPQIAYRCGVCAQIFESIVIAQDHFEADHKELSSSKNGFLQFSSNKNESNEENNQGEEDFTQSVADSPVLFLLRSSSITKLAPVFLWRDLNARLLAMNEAQLRCGNCTFSTGSNDVFDHHNCDPNTVTIRLDSDENGGVNINGINDNEAVTNFSEFDKKNSNLDIHRVRKMSRARSNEVNACKKCPLVFASKDRLDQHSLKHLAIPYKIEQKCPIKNKMCLSLTFKNAREMRTHFQTSHPTVSVSETSAITDTVFLKDSNVTVKDSLNPSTSKDCMDLPYSEHLATTTKINNKALYFDVGNKSIVIHNNNNNNENDNGYDPNEITAQMTDSIHVNHNVDNNVDHDVENTKNTDTVRVVATMRDVLRQLALANSTTVAPTQRAFLEVMGVLEQSYNGIDISSLIASKFLKINELEREKTIANTKSVFSRDFDARSAPPPNTRRQSKSNVGTDDIVKEQELKCRSESPSCKRMRVESTTIETTTSIEEEEVELQEDLSGDEDSNGARKQKIAGIAQENDNNEDVQEGTRKDEGSTLAAMLMQAAVASGALGGSVSTDGSTGSVDSANFQFLAAAAAAAAQNFAPASNFSPAAALQFLSRMAPLATSTTVTNSTSSVPLQAPSITISEAAGTAEGSSSAATSGSCASLQASYDALCSPAKRARTRITDDQLKILRQYFDINNSPSEEQIKEMSHKAQLPEKVIKHWFRNTLFKERQRDKDSPYNFNIPPQMSIDLATYEKTGEAKITSIKPELDGESSANSPSSSNAESKPKAQRGVSEVSEDPSESSGIDEPVVIIDEDRDQEPPTCQDYDNERRISSSGSEFSYKKEEFKESESSLSSESAHQQAQSSGLNGNMDLNSLLNGIVNVDTNLLSTLFVNAGFTMPFLSTASTSAVTPSLSQPASTVVNGASESAARHSPTVSIGTLSCGSASGLTVGSGRRANRTRFTDFQLRTLQNFFDRQAYPKDDDLEMLSKKLGLSPRVIVVWFQNARQKARKINENQPLAANVSGAPSFERVGVAPYFQCKRCVLQFSRFFDLVQHQQKVCYVNDPEALNIDNNSIDEGISDEERILADGMNPLLNGFLAAAAAGASAENFSPELLGALGAAAFGACNFKTSAKQNDENSENLFESMGLLDGSKAGTSGQIFSESDVERYAISEFGRPTATSPLDLSLANCAEKFNVFPSRDMRASTVSESGDDAQNLSRAVSTSPYAICTPSSALSAAAQMGTFLAQFAQQQHHHNQPQNSVGHFGAAGDNAAACAAAAAAAAAANNSKRYRTHLTPQQVFVMKSLFNDYKTPSMGECETLGREIGLHKRVVQVWFQNARAKERKCRSGGLMGSENASDDAPAKNGIAATRCELCALEFSAAGLSVQEHIFTHAHIERVRATMRTVGGGASEGAISESGTGTLDDASRANITQVVGAANSDLDASTVITSQFPYNLMCGLQSAGALSLMYDANLLGTPVARLQIPERVMQSIHEDLTRGAIATNFTQDGLNFEQLAEKISPRDFECSTSIETEVGWACTQCRNVFQHEDYLRAHQKHICKNCNDTFRLVQSYYECIVCKCKTGTQEEFRIHCDTLAHKSAVALFSRDSTPNRTNGTTAEATTTSA